MRNPHNDPQKDLVEIKNLIQALEQRMGDNHVSVKEKTLIVAEINKIQIRLNYLKDIYSPDLKVA